MKEGDIILCQKDDVGRISNKMQTQGNYYLINKWEKGQPKTIQCSCCGKVIDLTDSVDYAGAVQQWEDFGKKCYRCGTGRCNCKEKGKEIKESI